jgi:hypothetical protein
MNAGDPEMALFNKVKKGVKFASYKDEEPSRVETIRMLA